MDGGGGNPQSPSLPGLFNCHSIIGNAAQGTNGSYDVLRCSLLDAD
jgi:hypothetical protein